MKVIFLDHEGVICLSTEFGGRFKKQREAGRKLSQSVASLPVLSRFDNFNKKAIKVLNSILEETGAEIVVSSDWKRWANVEEMGEYYESQGIIKKPIDFTPNLGQCTHYAKEYPAGFPWNREMDLEQTRSIEIKQYLVDHPEIRTGDELSSVFFNPKIVNVSDKMISMKEGCLSFPLLFMNIKRPDSVRLRYQLADGTVHTNPFIGMTARIVLHEFDHMEGIVYTKRASKYESDRALRKRMILKRKVKKIG